MTTIYQPPMYDRLEQITPWNGGMLAGSDVVTLADAARFASKHAKTEITPADFLRAAGRGQIPMRAICPHAATMEPCRETDKPLTMPANSIPTLPLDACKSLSNTGRAAWRTIDWFEPADSFAGALCRFTRWKLPDTDPDIVTTPDDCRLTGWDVHKLADAFIEAPAQTAATPAPLVKLEARRGYLLALPSGQTHIQSGELPRLIADALWPDDGTDDEVRESNHAFCWLRIESEIERDIRNGTLPVKDALTGGPLTFLRGNAWKTGVATITDLRAYVAEREITLTITGAPEPKATTLSPASVVANDAPEKQVDAMKKAALIAALEYEWSSIEADIREATRNGLKAAAHTGKHGEWNKDKARAWATSKGKIKQAAPVHSLAGAWPGTTTRHTISR